MNVIFRLGEFDLAHKALCRIINELNPEKLFVICGKNTDLTSVQSKITETYFRSNELIYQYASKLDGQNIKPLDKTILDAYAPYLYTTMRIYERVLDVTATFDEKMQKIWKHVEYWNHIIDEYNIELCVLQTIPHEIYEYIIYALCEIKGVKTGFAYENTLLTHCYAMTSIDDHCTEINEEYSCLCEKYAKTDIEDIILDKAYQKSFDIQRGENDKDKTPHYMNDNSGGGFAPKTVETKTNQKSRVDILFDNFKKHGYVGYIKNIYLPAYFEMKRHRRFTNRMIKDVKKYFQYWDSKSKTFDYSSMKYFYFPLHMQPECTTLPMGGWFTEQLFAIKMIANNLPDDVYILVKEHPLQTLRNRSNSFIDELCAIKNVKLVPRDANTFELMQHCIAVATITGTALWEGVFSGKPGIMFGHHIKEYAPGIFYVSKNIECKQAVDLILNNEVNITLKDLKIFMLAMQNTCLPGCLANELSSTEEEMYDLFVCVLNKNGIYLK